MSLLGTPHPPHPGPAVRIGDHHLDREDLFAAAGAVADRVQSAPAVAVHATATLDTVVAVVGCLLAGVPCVPGPPDSGPEERTHILRDSHAALWLGDPPPHAVPGPGPETVPIDRAAGSSTTWTEPADGTALLMYTSGTTGAPKGACCPAAH